MYHNLFNWSSTEHLGCFKSFILNNVATNNLVTDMLPLCKQVQRRYLLAAALLCKGAANTESGAVNTEILHRSQGNTGLGLREPLFTLSSTDQ